MSLFILLSILIIGIVVGVLVKPLFAREPQSPDQSEHEEREQQLTDFETKTSKVARVSSLVYIGLVPLLLTIIYLGIGSPNAIDTSKTSRPLVASNAQPVGNNQLGPLDGQDQGPFQAIANLPPDQQQLMIAQMVSGLEERLKDSPDDIAGWRRLARSHSVMGNPEKSAEAWREILKRDPDITSDDWRGFAVALLDAGAGQSLEVNEELEGALKNVFSVDPTDPLALFFLGIAARDKGQSDEARRLWTTLRDELPEDTPILENIDDFINSVTP